MLDQLNEAADKVGGQWIKLNRVEQGAVVGELLDFEVRPKTFEGKAVLSSKSGQQRQDWVLTLRVPEDKREGSDDAGTRLLTLNESGQRALAAAIKESKARAAVGGTVKIAVVEDPPDDRKQAVYKAKYEPPTNLPAADAVFAGATTNPNPF